PGVREADCLVLFGAGASAPLAYKPMAAFVDWADGELELTDQEAWRLWKALRTELPADEAGDLEELFGVISLLANPHLRAVSPVMASLQAAGAGFDGVCLAADALERWLREAVFHEYARRQDWKAIDALYGPLLELLVERVRQVNA